MNSEHSILGLYRDNGKQDGSYYIKLGLFGDNIIIGIIQEFGNLLNEHHHFDNPCLERTSVRSGIELLTGYLACFPGSGR